MQSSPFRVRLATDRSATAFARGPDPSRRTCRAEGVHRGRQPKHVQAMTRFPIPYSQRAVGRAAGQSCAVQRGHARHAVSVSIQHVDTFSQLVLRRSHGEAAALRGATRGGGRQDHFMGSLRSATCGVPPTPWRALWRRPKSQVASTCSLCAPTSPAECREPDALRILTLGHLSDNGGVTSH